LNSKAQKALEASNIADKEYKKALAKANEKQKSFYEKEMPELLSVRGVVVHVTPSPLQFPIEFEMILLVVAIPPLKNVCLSLSHSLARCRTSNNSRRSASHSSRRSWRSTRDFKTSFLAFWMSAARCCCCHLS